MKEKTSIVRELHVYGSVVPVSARDPTKFQHQGFGTLLMEEAERIAKEEHKSHKISVISGISYIFKKYFFYIFCISFFMHSLLNHKFLIKYLEIYDNELFFSGVGTRNYYRKLGYELDGPYVSKMLI